MFGVILRVLGVILAIYALLERNTGIAHWIDPVAPHRFSVAADFLIGSITFVVAALLVKAEWLVRFAYGRTSN